MWLNFLDAVTWPGSKEQVLNQLAVNRYLVVEEPVEPSPVPAQ